jgi:hypothetical protein
MFGFLSGDRDQGKIWQATPANLGASFDTLA